MTVKELKRLLEVVDEKRHVVISKDNEGKKLSNLIDLSGGKNDKDMALLVLWAN